MIFTIKFTQNQKDALDLVSMNEKNLEMAFKKKKNQVGLTFSEKVKVEKEKVNRNTQSHIDNNK